jgi:hypothetical protein
MQMTEFVLMLVPAAAGPKAATALLALLLQYASKSINIEPYAGLSLLLTVFPQDSTVGDAILLQLLSLSDWSLGMFGWMYSTQNWLILVVSHALGLVIHEMDSFTVCELVVIKTLLSIALVQGYTHLGVLETLDLLQCVIGFVVLATCIFISSLVSLVRQQKESSFSVIESLVITGCSALFALGLLESLAFILIGFEPISWYSI